MTNPGTGSLRVLTVHFNTPDLTVRMVREFPGSKTPDGRVVSIHVLDNCSTPANLRALRAGIDGLPGVTLKVNDVNIGFGEGMNLLAQDDAIQDADLLWFLNPDTRVEPHCVELLEKELLAAEYGVVSPLIYSGDEDNAWIWYCGGAVGDHDLRPQFPFYGCGLDRAPKRPFETQFVTGAAPMMRASTFRSVGGFPPGYFLYWEDAGLSWKVRQAGIRIGVVPSARLWHAVGASSGVGRSQTFYYWYARNRFTFARDMGMARRQLLVGAGGIETVRVVARAMIERDGRMAKTRAAIRGTIAGWRGRQLPIE